MVMADIVARAGGRAAEMAQGAFLRDGIPGAKPHAEVAALVGNTELFFGKGVVRKGRGGQDRAKPNVRAELLCYDAAAQSDPAQARKFRSMPLGERAHIMNLGLWLHPYDLWRAEIAGRRHWHADEAPIFEKDGQAVGREV